MTEPRDVLLRAKMVLRTTLYDTAEDLTSLRRRAVIDAAINEIAEVLQQMDEEKEGDSGGTQVNHAGHIGDAS